MTSKQRSVNRGWEIRLGALQVVVWLGLALGSVFGAYFIGFFSGRYVGFETARAASGVDVPKLALTEEYPEKNGQAMAKVIDQLSVSAVVRQDEKETPSQTAPVADSRVAKAAQDLKQDVDSRAQESEASAVVKKDPLSDQDAIFNEDLEGSGLEEEITGTGGAARVLGRDDSKKVATQDEPKLPVKQPSTVEQKTVKEAPKEKVSVTKRLPRGYFAQVAAPKERGEAEDLARRLRKSGFPVVVEDNSTGRSPFYRVMVGPETNKVQADRLLGQLKRERYLDGKMFVREVK